MTEAVQSKAIAAPTLSQSDLDALDKFYSFRNRAEILPFLAIIAIACHSKRSGKRR